MHLDPEQEEALSVLVEAARNMPSKLREPFMAIQTDGDVNLIVQHKGLAGGRYSLYPSDFDILARVNFIGVSIISPRAVWQFDILPPGFAYYKAMKERSGGPVETVESNVRKYLEGDRLRITYPEAIRS